MLKRKLHIRTWFLLLILLFAMPVWSASAYDPDEDVIAKLVLSTNEVTLEEESSASVTATAIYSDGSSEVVTSLVDWSTADDSIATVYNGTITARGEGLTTIVAVFEGFSQSVTVEVNKKVKALTKNVQELTLLKDETETITLTATYSDNSTADVTEEADWYSDDETVATVVNGTVTGHRSGTATISAVYGSKITTVEVEVELVQRLIPDQQQLSLLMGESGTIVLTALYPDGSTRDVTSDATWTTSNSEVADVVNGIVTAYGSGTAVITASYGSQSTSIDVDVDTTVKIELDEQILYMRTDDTYQLTLTATYPDGDTADVADQAEWTSSDEDVVYVYKGKLTAVDSGSATITATYSNKTVEMTVDVDVVEELDVSEDTFNLKAGQSVPITLTATYIDLSTEDVTEEATWSSSQRSVAYVQNGNLYARKQGEVEITATYKGKSVTITVDVNIPRKLVASPEDLAIGSDEQEEISLVAVYADGSEEVVPGSDAEWTSSNESVAEVEDGIVTGISSGSANITATYGTRSVTVEVDVDILQNLRLDTDELVLNEGDAKQLTLTATYMDGTEKDITSKATWSSSNTDVAFVYKGNVIAQDMGTVEVSATFGGITVSAEVNVSVPTNVVLSSDEISLDVNGTYQLSLVATYEDGTELDVSSDAEWSSSNSQIARVSDGLVTGVSEGTTTITVTYYDQTFTVDVEVGTATNLQASTRLLTLSVDESQQIVLTALDREGNTKDVTDSAEWSTNNASVADVYNGVVTAYSKGKAVITAQYASLTVTIDVEVDIVEKIELSEKYLMLASGETAQLQAIVTYSNGRQIDVTDLAEWESSDYTEVSVNNEGLVTAVAYGKAYISAEYAGKSVRIAVEVDQLKYLYTDEVSLTLQVGDEVQLTATAVYPDNTERDVTTDAVWSSSKILTATAINGLIRATGDGKATITVKFGNKKTKVVVYVEE